MKILGDLELCNPILTHCKLFFFRTGRNNLADVGKVHSWDDQTALDFWKNDTEYCNAITGTDGSTFHPEIERNETLHIFNRDLCRSLPLVYQKDVVEDNGIPGYRLVILTLQFYKVLLVFIYFELGLTNCIITYVTFKGF